MTRLKPIATETAGTKTKQLLDAVQAKLKMTPNMMRTMANSPAVLEAYLQFSGSLAAGSLPTKIRTQIALAVAEQNGCQYCLSAHTALGKMGGLTESEMEAARESKGPALEFARRVVANRGRMADGDFEAIRQAGFSDSDIAEIIAHVALNIFTNYFNTAAQVEVDFPKIELHQHA
jgi:uncharacterized peroxidase-related enzyme